MRRLLDHPGALKTCSALLPLIVVMATLAQAQQAPLRAAFFSSVQPENPTEADSASIVSSGYFLFGSAVVDSTFSLSGTRFSVGFTAVRDALQAEQRMNSSRSLGRLAAGTYKIVTSSQHIDTGLGGVPDTTRYVDTTSFTVFPASANPPRVVATSVSYVSTVGSHPVAYYYWNGDTLSIATVLMHADMPAEFISRAVWSSDTLVLTLVDTTLRSHRMLAGYAVVSSIAHVNPGKFPVRVAYQRRTVKSPYTTPVFHQLAVDNTQEALTLSVKSPGAAEFTLFPIDTEQNGYAYFLSSPFLDAVNLMSFQPNPSCTAPKHPSLFIGDVYAGYDLVEDWESYRAGAWTSVSVQQTDRLDYDTINADGNHWLKVAYSNTANKAVKSYLYRNLDSVMVSSSHSIRLDLSFISPEPSSVRRGGVALEDRASGTGMHVRASGASVQISATLPVGATNAHARFAISDLRGRTIRMLQPASVKGSSQLAVTWDRCDAWGKGVPAGVYSVRLVGHDISGRGEVIAIR